MTSTTSCSAARALDVDAVVPCLRQLAQEAHRLGEKPPQTSLMSTSTSCPPSSAAWYLAVRAAPSLRSTTTSFRGAKLVADRASRRRRAGGVFLPAAAARASRRRPLSLSLSYFYYY